MAYAVRLLDRSVHGRHTHLLQAWDAALKYLRAGWARVAIVQADDPEQIVMVVGPRPPMQERAPQ